MKASQIQRVVHIKAIEKNYLLPPAPLPLEAGQVRIFNVGLFDLYQLSKPDLMEMGPGWVTDILCLKRGCRVGLS